MNKIPFPELAVAILLLVFYWVLNFLEIHFLISAAISFFLVIPIYYGFKRLRDKRK